MAGEASFRVGVLASGSGSTFEAVHAAAGGEDLPDTEIAFVISNNDAERAGVWERAERLGVPIHHVSNRTQRECTLPERRGTPVPGTISFEASERITQLADEHGVHMLVGLGFMKRVVGRALQDVAIANSHLGPLGPLGLTAGLRLEEVQRKVMAEGWSYSGPTFHWMDTRVDEDGLPAYDTGAEIGHMPVPVTDEMRSEWERTGEVTLLKEAVMDTEKLWVPRWIHKALLEIDAPE